VFQSGDPNAFCLDTTCFGAYLIDVVSVAVAVSRRLVRPQLMMVGGGERGLHPCIIVGYHLGNI
jgi:hypothetical protein